MDGDRQLSIPASRTGLQSGTRLTPGVPARHSVTELASLTTDATRPSAGWIVRRVSALLSHFFQAGAADEVRTLAERDWVLALGSLPEWAVSRACDEAAMESLHRPVPAAVRLAALRLTAPYEAELNRRRAVALPEPEIVRAKADAVRGILAGFSSSRSET